MPAPGVSIIWEDQSQIEELKAPLEDGVDRPIFMTVTSADKGPEEWKGKVFGEDFYKYYGKVPSFYRHGQAIIQAANIIDAGGYLTIKRVVAEDATLANVGVVAKVTNTRKQKVDPVTKKGLWIDQVTNKITTTPQYLPNGDPDDNAIVYENHVNIGFVLKTVALSGNNVNQFATTFLAANRHTNPIGTNGEYPLFLILDNGHCHSVVALVNAIAVKIFGGGGECFVNIAKPRLVFERFVEPHDSSVSAVKCVHIGAYEVMCHYCLFQEVISVFCVVLL